MGKTKVVRAGWQFKHSARMVLYHYYDGINSYRHPHEETLSRLSDAGSKVYRTDQQGEVTLYYDGEKVWLNQQKSVQELYNDRPHSGIDLQSPNEREKAYLEGTMD